jgi:hypothetical protein
MPGPTRCSEAAKPSSAAAIQVAVRQVAKLSYKPVTRRLSLTALWVAPRVWWRAPADTAGT